MTLTFVVVCSKCGGLTLAKADQKTRTCPYCGATIIPERAKKLGVCDIKGGFAVDAFFWPW